MIVNVLGVEYDIELIEEKDEFMKFGGLVGHTDFTSKKIKVLIQKKIDDLSSDNQKINQNNIIRHELIHAFLFESGIDMGMQFHNEECVDFFAMQLPKILKMLEILDCKE